MSKQTRDKQTVVLTSGHDDPDEIHQDVVQPKVVSLWSTVGPFLDVVVEQARQIV